MYSTFHELNFVENLGKFSDKKISRLELLKQYQRTINHRYFWQGINKREVERHVMMLIELEQIR